MDRPMIRLVFGRGSLIVSIIVGALVGGKESNAVPVEKRVLVVFRFDDYSSRSSVDIETGVIDAFQKRRICCTFGVIPYVYGGDTHLPVSNPLLSTDVSSLTPVKMAALSRAVQTGAIEVALHGYSHRTIRDRGNGGYTEFAGLDALLQESILQKGKLYLEQQLHVPVTIFIPPWDSYDTRTLRVLEKLGFRCLSAGIYADTYGDALGISPLKMLPATCELHNLQTALETARKGIDAQPMIIVLVHFADFEGVDDAGKIEYREF
jgi:peptidoglycan/xylan/chitin deacetylase (PgdA/CDA1 family)